VANRAALAAFLGLLAGCASEGVPDPIPDIPAAQQRTTTRSEFDWRWPFSVGVGTLGCQSGAVVFRHRGTNYALNEAAAKRGHGSPQSITMPESSRPPSNPLSRLKQEDRMQIFAAASKCGADPCRERLREARGLSAEELKQIEDEGRERTWPPLPRKPRDLAPLVEAGLKLCQGT
jgi:Protein of unknown function (DUF2511)